MMRGRINQVFKTASLINLKPISFLEHSGV
jgi:hypothetical protein